MADSPHSSLTPHLHREASRILSFTIIVLLWLMFSVIETISLHRCQPILPYTVYLLAICALLKALICRIQVWANVTFFSSHPLFAYSEIFTAPLDGFFLDF
jgi:hypothetical protein